jgi:hypothetical protein
MLAGRATTIMTATFLKSKTAAAAAVRVLLALTAV